MKERIKAFLGSKLIKFAISLFLLFYLFRKADFSLLYYNLRKVNWLFFSSGVALLPLCLIIRAYNWGLVLNREEEILNLKELNKLNLIALGANLFLPASAGEVVKAYYASRWHGQKEKFYSSVFLDKLTSLIAIFFLGALFSFFGGFTTLAFFSSISAVFSIILLFSPKIFLLLFRFFSGDSNVEAGFGLKEGLAFSIISPLRLFWVLHVSLFGWIMTYFQLFLFCSAFGAKISFSYLLSISSALVLARLFPFAFNGLGSGEAAFVYFFSLKGVASNLAILVSLSSQLINAFVPGLLGIALFSRENWSSNRKKGKS